MGMFDEIKCKMPLPVALDVDHRDHWFQTKSLVCQCDCYEIREDGTLWKEHYDTVDHSNPNAVGWERLIGMCSKTNQRWEHESSFTGDIVFYTQASGIGKKDKNNLSGWIEFSANFIDGYLNHLVLLSYEKPSWFCDIVSRKPF